MNSKKTILAVDDTTESLALLSALLTPAGYEVRPADSGELAIASLQHRPTDLVLLDIRMPGMDGLEVIRQLKAHEQTRRIPIILMSGYAEVDDWVKGLKLGAVDYISKPFQTEELLSRVRTHLALSQTEALSEEASTLRQAKAELEAEISRRQQVEDELRQSEERYRLLIETTEQGVWLVDQDWRTTFTNPRMEQMLGCPPGGMRGRHVGEFMDEAGRLAAMSLMKERERGLRDTHEFRFLRKDGSELWALIATNPITSDSGKFMGALAMATDITERRALEARAQQVRRMESIGQLAGGVAHDFNNILAAMMMHLSLLRQNRNLDEGTRESLQELMLQSKRAASLTRQLLMFGQRASFELRPVDLNDLVANLLRMLGRLLGGQISLEFDQNGDLPLLQADVGMIEEVLVKLAINARDAMPNGGKLIIRTEPVEIESGRIHRHQNTQPGQFVCLTVADTGCGMDEATRKRVFEPFFTTKSVGKGEGLGLATVYGVIAQHKGWIELESEPGQGTVFRVFLPATATKGPEPAQGEPSPIPGGHETILLVEDEPTVRRALAQGLRSLGYKVLEADNGQAAVQLWHQHSEEIDMLFSDMIMAGGLNGLDLANKFQKEKLSLKVVISSGYNTEMLHSGKSDRLGTVYLSKPYQIEELSTTVRRCLDG
jgi:two-component system cell cycle sensor histidine kinase/response regulator CckA